MSVHSNDARILRWAMKTSMCRERRTYEHRQSKRWYRDDGRPILGLVVDRTRTIEFQETTAPQRSAGAQP